MIPGFLLFFKQRLPAGKTFVADKRAFVIEAIAQ